MINLLKTNIYRFKFKIHVTTFTKIKSFINNLASITNLCIWEFLKVRAASFRYEATGAPNAVAIVRRFPLVGELGADRCLLSSRVVFGFSFSLDRSPL